MSVLYRARQAGDAFAVAVLAAGAVVAGTVLTCRGLEWFAARTVRGWFG